MGDERKKELNDSSISKSKIKKIIKFDYVLEKNQDLTYDSSKNKK